QLFKVGVAIDVGKPRPALHGISFQKIRAVRLAEIRRQQLRVRVGDVQQGDVAERLCLVQRVGRLRVGVARAQNPARRGGGCEKLEEFAALQASGLRRLLTCSPEKRDRADT